MKNSTEYKVDLLNRLKDPEYAALYLNTILIATDEDDSSFAEANFLLALRDVATAFGVSEVAKNANLNRQNIYKMLSKNGNPEFYSLMALLKAIGLRISIELDDNQNEAS